MATDSPNSLLRLRKHADYGRVYNASRKQFGKQIAYFYSIRPVGRRSETPGPRIGLTVPKVLGKAHERNRIKRRLRECIRRHAKVITYPVDVILHPRRSTMETDIMVLDREVLQIFRGVQGAILKTQKLPASITPAER